MEKSNGICFGWTVFCDLSSFLETATLGYGGGGGGGGVGVWEFSLV